MKKILVLLFFGVTLGACGQSVIEENRKANFEESQKSIIVYVDETQHDFEDSVLILAIPSVNLENADNLNLTKEDWVIKAQNHEGAYYVIHQEVYAELDLEIGKEFIAYYDGEGESDPPVRFVEEIKLTSE
ncbi:hypothetical protein [Oceanobacillus sp. CAU 1775]